MERLGDRRGGAGLQPGQFGAMRAGWKEVAF